MAYDGDESRFVDQQIEGFEGGRFPDKVEERFSRKRVVLWWRGCEAPSHSRRCLYISGPIC